MFALIKRLLGGGDAAPRARRIKPEAIAPEDLRELLISHRQTTICLTPTDQPRFCKLGGAPDADGLEWPINSAGEPMAFVAQLDLADVRAGGGPDWLPPSGSLYFFTETQSICPSDGGRVLYVRNRVDGVQASPPPGAEVFGERHVGLEAQASYPSTDWLNVTERCFDFDDDEVDALLTLRPGRTDDGPDHRCGGYPGEVQDGYFAAQCELWDRGGDVSIGKLAKDPAAFESLNAEAIQRWRLLLQIDNDESVGMTWYDAGRIYYFIKEEDARAGDFSKVQFDIQFC